MKIRIKGNSLRYRLTRPEVEEFNRTEFIQEKINFGSSELYYTLCSTSQDKLFASFNDKGITLYIPASRIKEWTTTDQVGFEHEMELNDTGETLHLLLEKDFTCLDKVDEDQSDHYPNPLLNEIYE